jgi:type IV pilus biogenesis protein CpaD/CtpE
MLFSSVELTILETVRYLDGCASQEVLAAQMADPTLGTGNE